MATDTQVMLWFVVDPLVWTNCWITGQQGWWRCGGWERVQTQPPPPQQRRWWDCSAKHISYAFSTIKLWDVHFHTLDLWIITWFNYETSSHGNFTLNPWNQTCWYRDRLRSSICVGQSTQQVPEQLPEHSKGSVLKSHCKNCIRGTTPGVRS